MIKRWRNRPVVVPTPRGEKNALVLAAGNVVGRYEGERPGLPCLMLGSHLEHGNAVRVSREEARHESVERERERLVPSISQAAVYAAPLIFDFLRRQGGVEREIGHESEQPAPVPAECDPLKLAMVGRTRRCQASPDPLRFVSYFER